MGIYQAEGGWQVSDSYYGQGDNLRDWVEVELSLYLMPSSLYADVAVTSIGDDTITAVQWYRNGVEIENPENFYDQVGTSDKEYGCSFKPEHPGALGTYSYTCEVFVNGTLERTLGPYTLEVVETIERDAPIFVSISPSATYRVGDDTTPITCEAQVSDGGVLSYVWNCVITDSGGKLIGTNSGSGNSITPTTDNPGIYNYVFAATNSVKNDNYLGGKSTKSDAITITVLPQFDLPSFQLGIAVGLGLKGFGYMHEGKQEPIAYLYNGVRLPKLPEWDRGVYPYAAIAVRYNGDYLFFYNDTAITVDANGEPSIFTTARSYATRTQWGDFVTDYLSAEKIVWANSDIYTTDGTLYLASSDPVPTYEDAVYDSDWNYNGSVFPKLPEWDKTTYPYAFIVDEILYVTGGIPSYRTAEEHVYWPVRGDDDTAARATHNKLYTQWSSLTKVNKVANVKGGVVIWANVDIYDENGDLVIAKSDPAPVHE